MDSTLFALGMPGMQELLIIGVIVMMLFGAKRLPEFARGLGKSWQELRKAKEDFTRELEGGDERKD